ARAHRRIPANARARRPGARRGRGGGRRRGGEPAVTEAPAAGTRTLPAWLLVTALIGVVLPTYLVIHAHRVNGFAGFPLDDPWIHLTYARNLHDHLSFSYFPGEQPTAGSTSPLYALLLAMGFVFTRDEKALSYALGLLFHGAFLVAAALWARKQLGGALWAAAFALILAFDAWIAIL